MSASNISLDRDTLAAAQRIRQVAPLWSDKHVAKRVTKKTWTRDKNIVRRFAWMTEKTNVNEVIRK